MCVCVCVFDSVFTRSGSVPNGPKEKTGLVRTTFLSRPCALWPRQPVCAHYGTHIAAAAVPYSVLQYLQSGQVAPLAKTTGSHRLLLMMSFLRRIALKSVMAAKQESVAKCAGPLQYGVGCPDGANTMIKTIQLCTEADPTRVLLPLISRRPFRTCRDVPCFTTSSKTTRTLLLSPPDGTLEIPRTRSTWSPLAQRSAPTVELIKDCSRH